MTQAQTRNLHTNLTTRIGQFFFFSRDIKFNNMHLIWSNIGLLYTSKLQIFLTKLDYNQILCFYQQTSFRILLLIYFYVSNLYSPLVYSTLPDLWTAPLEPQTDLFVFFLSFCCFVVLICCFCLFFLFLFFCFCFFREISLIPC